MKHLTSLEAYAFLQKHPDALFLDVRMEIEYLYVGHPPGVVHLSWYEYPEMAPHPERFVHLVERELAGDKTRPVVLICRSGKRTVDAGLALEAAGFTDVSHVVDGFEGELDNKDQRGNINGWRHAGLPWEQL
jgi:rhodanese-related sulfurtransferase